MPGCITTLHVKWLQRPRVGERIKLSTRITVLGAYGTVNTTRAYQRHNIAGARELELDGQRDIAKDAALTAVVTKK